MKFKKHSIIYTFIIFVFIASSCSKSEHATHQGREGSSANKVKLSVAEGVLSGTPLDALDLIIAINAVDTAFNPISLSSNLKERLSKYSDGSTYKLSIKGAKSPLVNGGAKMIIPNGGEFICKYKGDFNFEIKIVEGEVGVLNGDIYVKEGTRVLIDNVPYTFIKDKWRQTK